MLKETLFAACLSVLFWWNIGIVNQPSRFLTTEHVEEYPMDSLYISKPMWGFMSSCMCLGALIGALTGSRFLQAVTWPRESAKRSHERAILLTGILFWLGINWFGLAVIYGMLIAGRLAIGIAVGWACILTPAYLSLIVNQTESENNSSSSMPPGSLPSDAYVIREPSSIAKSAICNAHQLGIVLGLVGVEGMCYFLGVRNWRWRVVSLTPVLFITAQALLLWLISKPRRAVDAETGMSITQLCNGVASRKVLPMPLSAPEARKSLFLALFLHSSQQLCGINCIIYFSQSLANDDNIGDSGWHIGLLPFTLAIFNLLGTLVAMFIVSKHGRRPLLILSVGVMMTCAGMLIPLSKASSWAESIFLYGFVGSFAIGMGPIPWLILTEIFPITTKREAVNKGDDKTLNDLIDNESNHSTPDVHYDCRYLISAAVCVNWLTNTLVTILFYPLLSVWGKTGLYSCITVNCFLILLVTFMWMPETKDYRPARFIS